MQIKPKGALTFANCLEMGLQNHTEAIAKVAEVAAKEFSIEQVREYEPSLVCCRGRSIGIRGSGGGHGVMV